MQQNVYELLRLMNLVTFVFRSPTVDSLMQMKPLGESILVLSSVSENPSHRSMQRLRPLPLFMSR